MVALFSPPRYTPVNGNGETLPGAKLEFYQTGTSTPQDTYSDAGLTTPNANPVVADADGMFGAIYLGTTDDYKVILKRSDDTVIYTVDPVPKSTVAVSDAAFGKAIYGLTYGNGADTTNDIDIAAGGAMDATGAYFMALETALTKRLDAAWSVGTNQGGRDTGSIANTDYYIWLIARPDTGVVDALFSASSTSPTMPANYTYKRLVGWFKRASNTIVAFKTYELPGGGLDFAWSAPRLDVDVTSLTTSRQLDVLSVPTAFATLAKARVVTGAASGYAVLVSCPDETDAAPDDNASPGSTFWLHEAGGYGQELRIMADSSGRWAARSSVASTTYYVVTRGFEWSRR